MPAATALLDAAALIEARQPFVLVTVVWRRGPSSGRAGSKAIILADGTLQGGSAARVPSHRHRARARLPRDRASRAAVARRSGTVTNRANGHASAPMACESDGALEVYMEPIVPAVRLICIGRSPAVDALAAMGLALGWDALIVDDGGRADDHPSRDRSTKLDLSATVVDGATAIVVRHPGPLRRPRAPGGARHRRRVSSGWSRRQAGRAILDQLESDGVAEDLVAGRARPASTSAPSRMEIAARSWPTSCRRAPR